MRNFKTQDIGKIGKFWAFSSAAEHLDHTQGVADSNSATPSFGKSRRLARALIKRATGKDGMRLAPRSRQQQAGEAIVGKFQTRVKRKTGKISYRFERLGDTMISGKKMTHWTPEKIRELRGRYGETQKQFVERLGVDIWTLRYWEQGRGLPGGPARILMDRLEEDLSNAKALAEAV